MIRRAPLVVLGILLMAPQARAASFGVEVEGGYFDMTGAKDSAKAVFDGSSGGFIFGGAVRVGLSHHFGLALGVRRFSKDGERVFVADPNGEVFPLGHPLKVRTLPIALVATYRILPDSRLVPYVGAGAGLTSFKEETTVGGLTESDSSTKFSIHALAGVEFSGKGPIGFGIEAQWFTAPNSVGLAGVSAVYDEKDVGGLSIAAKISFGGRHK
jgi:opacity protein-like surface antigen